MAWRPDWGACGRRVWETMSRGQNPVQCCGPPYADASLTAIPMDAAATLRLNLPLPLTRGVPADAASINTGAQGLVRDLVRLRRLRAPPALRHAAATTWARHWWTQLSVAVQRAMALSAVGRAWPAGSLSRSNGRSALGSCWTSQMERGPAPSPHGLQCTGLALAGDLDLCTRTLNSRACKSKCMARRDAERSRPVLRCHARCSVEPRVTVPRSRTRAGAS